MSFRPLACADRWYGILAMVGLVGLDAVAVSIILHRPLDGLSFLLALWVLASLLILIYLGYRTVGAFTLEYWMDRDAVTMVWGPSRQIVPIGQIQRIVMGDASYEMPPARPWHWPCRYRRRGVPRSRAVRDVGMISDSLMPALAVAPGEARATAHGPGCDELGVVNSYATRPLTEQLILVTAEESYGVSPARPLDFLDALQTRYSLGVARVLPAELRRPPVWTWLLWRDRVALALIGVGLLGVLLMFGVLCFRFPALSSYLPLHFDVGGMPDRIEAKSGLFVLPLIGLIAWGFNMVAGVWLYRQVQEGAAYLLWGGAVVVQLVAGLALFNLMRW